jgi:hypothetical protein
MDEDIIIVIITAACFGSFLAGIIYILCSG